MQCLRKRQTGSNLKEKKQSEILICLQYVVICSFFLLLQEMYIRFRINSSTLITQIPEINNTCANFNAEFYEKNLYSFSAGLGDWMLYQILEENVLRKYQDVNIVDVAIRQILVKSFMRLEQTLGSFLNGFIMKIFHHESNSLWHQLYHLF